VPAMLFGVAAVNKYYDYYQTWAAVAADLGGQGASQVVAAPAVNRASARQIAAGVLSGYFTPVRDQLGNPPKRVDPFGANAAGRRTNTPQLRVGDLPVSATIPPFWLGVGGRDRAGLRQARRFQRVLLTRQPAVRLNVVPGATPWPPGVTSCRPCCSG
jgi:hypothetical protein